MRVLMIGILFAATAAPAFAHARINPQICVNTQKSGRGYIVMKETWVLPMLRLREGQRIMPTGPEGMMIAGQSMTDLIEKTCSVPAS